LTDFGIDQGDRDFGAAFVVHVAFSADPRPRTASARLEEAIGLARAIDLDVRRADIVTIANPRPATLLGGGRVEALREALDAESPRPALVIIDAALTPVQHRNLEKELDAKVLDRTALILEIFGERARTGEGRLQVDLAHLTYQKSRLVRSWTHLERQRGGRGFLGGPGERQIESDRRAIQNQIDKLKERLEQVRRTRTLQREKRKKAPHPVVALVGYTNAGKSTLFNVLSKSDVVARDQLFATLDPTMRAVDLPSGQRIILSDTVGFISDLPTQLVAAFRATLEEVNEADLILHVRDIAHEDTEAQRDDVINVLAQLGLDASDGRPVIEVLNKVDLVEDDEREAMIAASRLARSDAPMSIEDPARIAISAVTGEGLSVLCDLIDAVLTVDRETFEISVDSANGAAIAWLHSHGDVQSEEKVDAQVSLRVRLSAKSAGQFRKIYSEIALVPRSFPASRGAA
jgi:GTP-binding protein HflX